MDRAYLVFRSPRIEVHQTYFCAAFKSFESAESYIDNQIKLTVLEKLKYDEEVFLHTPQSDFRNEFKITKVVLQD